MIWLSVSEMSSSEMLLSAMFRAINDPMYTCGAPHSGARAAAPQNRCRLHQQRCRPAPGGAAHHALPLLAQRQTVRLPRLAHRHGGQHAKTKCHVACGKGESGHWLNIVRACAGVAAGTGKPCISVLAGRMRPGTATSRQQAAHGSRRWAASARGAARIGGRAAWKLTGREQEGEAEAIHTQRPLVQQVERRVQAAGRVWAVEAGGKRGGWAGGLA